MSIAAAKRRRRQVAKCNRHLAKIGRPGTPKKISASKSARRLAKLIGKEKLIQQRKGQKNKG